MGSYKMCLCFTRKFRWVEAAPPADVKDAFAAFTGGAAQMTADQLRRFLVESQAATPEEAESAERLVQHFSRRDRLFHKHFALTVEDFHHFLFSVEFNSPIRTQVRDGMDDPASHYYVYTGHNSYLTGNQLSSDCSDVPIVNALQRGVRVIELDMWPNSTKDNVDILHGRTLTSPVELIKCLRSIKQHAFDASPYPVVITLEDHLTPDLQTKVAEMITSTFGNLLFHPETEYIAEFPSPESLKNRILISTKPPKEYLDAKDDDDSQKGNHEPDDGAWGTEVPGLKDEVEDDKNDDEDEDDDDDQKQFQSSAPAYRRIITITAGKPKGGLKEALHIDLTKVRRLSLSEGQLVKASKTYGTEIVRFTQRNILRVYPKGTRFNSSNYNPLIGWMHGAQMVAFNMQGYGRSLWVMQGFFRANGGVGYIKKPDFLMKEGANNEVFDPQAILRVKRTLKVKVYMGDGWRFDFKPTHFDNYSPPDFYTRVGIAGVPADTVMKKTKTKEDNWTPVWDEEFTFLLTVPELAVLRIEVHEYDMSEKDDFGGQTCLPVSELKQGIRAIPLYNRKGIEYNSVKLLMRFQFC